MKNVTIGLIAFSLLFAVLLSLCPSASSGGKTLSETAITRDNGNYERVITDKKTYNYDFSESDIKFYSQESSLSTANLRTNMIFGGGVLSCAEGKTFSFGSSVFLGDDYGVYGGGLSFKLKLDGGKLSAGVRLSKKAADSDHRGIWFNFDNGALTVK